MAIPYPYVTNNPTHINTGSYLNKDESDMLVSGYTTDLWYGFSEKDVIEVSVFDLNQNPLGWATVNTEKNYRKVDLTYLDSKDRPIAYSFNELISEFLLYKNVNILVNPIDQLSSSFGITQGSYILTYNFTREMAGQPTEPLVVKDISPSRKEIKLVPKFSNNPRYEAFCKKKFQIKDVAPLLIQVTNGCPCQQIYSGLQEKFSKEIGFLKELMFLETDGAFVTFLKTIYDDVVVYTTPEEAQPLDKIKRIQGVRTSYQNFLLSNYETISDFIEIDNTFDSIVEARVTLQFKPYGTQTGQDFVSAKKFLIEFFTTYFYHPITLSTKAAFDEKYYSYFKNALNLGNNTFFVILDHAFLDERMENSDPLTLLIKLKSELPDEVKIQTECWVSNISIAPYVVNAILRQQTTARTTKISAPNFSLESETVSLYNINQSYTAADLRDTSADQQTIDINKKISELQVDYTDFSNFIIFSSAQQRLVNFKKKISTWSMVSSSLVTLNLAASTSLAAGTVYSGYSLERGALQSQMTDIVESFDGYESYLFKSGSYTYSPVTNAFLSASYVVDQDEDAIQYDKENRDSLLNNTPQHIVLDSGNDNYLTFLNMAGHFFDNIYLYIRNLPSERVVENDPVRTLSKKMVDYMLESFGWKIGSSYEDASTLQTYLTSATSSLSTEDRSKAIRTRILSTLPQIYKTKGTEEAIKLLLACYGIPSNLLDVREYGNDDYSTASLVTYTKQERSCLLGFSGSGALVDQYFLIRPSTRTVEFKLAIDHPATYVLKKNLPVVSSKHTYYDVSGPPYTSSLFYTAWEIGIKREYGNMGRVYAVLGSGSISLGRSTINLTSSLLPIFDGEIFNILLRRNSPDSAYEYNANEQLVPTNYDLIVQRNNRGRKVFRSFHRILGHYADNMIWDGVSADTLVNNANSMTTTTASHVYWGQLSGQEMHYSLGNAMIWDEPISDSDFEVHCNDFSSFAYSGSEGEKHLIARMDADEATNFITSSGSGYIPNKSEYYSTFVQRFPAIVSSGSTWTGSITGVYGKSPLPYHFLYSNESYYPLNVTISRSPPDCQYVTRSIYPYEYVVKTLEKTYTTPSYGPNRFRNEKVKSKFQNVAARLDDKNRSTYDQVHDIQSDSNLLGLYLDPQDAKNRDIVKFYGNRDIVDRIADPASMFSSSYSDLNVLNQDYNSFGDRKVLYNELITLYKIYFNRSVFDSVKNIVPARASVRTGILIEPTVLERPKYQHRPIFSESETGSVAYFDVTASHYFRDPITKLVRFHNSVGNTSNGKLELLYGEFNLNTSSTTGFDVTSLPLNRTANINLSYINEVNFNYPTNYNGGMIPDLPDNVQLGNFGSPGRNFGFPEADGLTTQENLNRSTHGDGTDPAFLVKQWNKYTIFFKSGSYVRTSTRSDDLYSSQSIWLYKLVAMTPDGFRSVFYTQGTYVPSGSINDLTSYADIQFILGVPNYFHRANTAKGTPNQQSNIIKGTEFHSPDPNVPVSVVAPYYSIAKDTYFESFRGYPRNHYTHKRMQFSPMKFRGMSGRARRQGAYIYVRGSQTVNTTIDDSSGLEDSSLPVQSIQTSNVNLVQSDNVINQ
jgi:hypothetical protein